MVVQILVQRAAYPRVLEERQQDRGEGCGTGAPQAYNRIPKRERVPLFSHAADVWLANKAGLAPKSKERYEQCVVHLKEEFGKALVCDVDANDIADYRRKRLSAGEDKRGVSNRTVNYEIGALRGVLRQFGLWGPIADRVRALPERHDVERAEMVLKKRVTEAIENRWFDKRNVGVVPFSEFAETYINRHVALLKSPKTERVRVLFWKREFGNRPIGQLTRAELQDWQARKRQTNKPATVNRIMCRLRNMFNKAVEWELLDESPMERLKFLPENNARLRYLSMDDCDKLLQACIAPHMRFMVMLALHTGMRLGEIFNLKLEDLDFSNGSILIRDSKNGHPRHIPMDSAVRDLLSSYIPSLGTSHVFPSASGGRLSTVQKAFRNARIRAGMPELHFHDLRHTFASQWVMNGGDLYVLKDILGHKSIAMTQRYAHLSQRLNRRWSTGWSRCGKSLPWPPHQHKPHKHRSTTTKARRRHDFNASPLTNLSSP
jgi:integrase